MTSWVVDVETPAMASRLADPRIGPLAIAGLPGSITPLADGWLAVSQTAVESLACLGMHDDGRVTWEDGPVLHIGRDRHQLTPADSGGS